MSEWGLNLYLIVLDMINSSEKCSLNETALRHLQNCSKSVDSIFRAA